MNNGYRGSGELERVLTNTPAPIQEAWRDAFEGFHGTCTPEQKDLIAAWVNNRVAGIPIPQDVIDRAERSTRERCSSHLEAQSAA